VQKVRWEKGGTARAEDYKFFYVKKEKIINWELDFLYTTEYYRQLSEWSLLELGCCI